MSGSDPEETAPFTHRPYSDRDKDENPFISPSGPAGQPSGPSYVAPQPPPPPMSSPPYGPPLHQPPVPAQGWGQGYVPVYGAALPGTLDHKGATTSLVLGIISVVCLVLGVFCCVTIPGVLCAPFAWAAGARAKREIDASPGVYRNRGAAQAGVVMGIIGSTIGILMVLAIAAFAVLIGSGWSWV